MTRGTLSLLLFLLLAVDIHASQESLANSFDPSVKPCDDLARHVCVDKWGMKVALRERNEGLFNDIVKVLGRRRQDGFDRIVKAAEKAAKTTKEQESCRFKNININETDFKDDSKKFKIGKAYGEMIAYGRFVEGLSSGKEVRVFWQNGPAYYVVHIGDKSRLEQNETLDDVKNEFVKGIFQGFFGKILGSDFDRKAWFVYHDLKVSDFKEVISGETYWEKKNSDLSSIGTKGEAYRYNVLLRTNGFTGYGNVLFAHTMYTHKSELNPGVADDLEALKESILEKIRNSVLKASWIKNDHKKNITDYIDSYKIVIGIDKKYRNPAVLKEMIDVYEQEFSKVTVGEKCELEMLSRAHGIARHRLLFTDRTLIPSLSKLQYETSIIDYNAFHTGNSIHMLPGFLHILNNYKLSTGFKYGYVGWSIGHEIFHGLGITKNRASMYVYLKGVTKEQAFINAEQCYLEFYEEKQFCMNNGPCPVPGKKADEGFSDVEAARIVFPILQEALKGRRARKRRGAKDSVELPLFDWRPPGVSEEDVLMAAGAADYSEEEWFFIGLQFVACQILDRKQEELAMKTDEHPRSQIRINAVAQQMKAFTKAFGCEKGQRNFLTEKQCALYSPKDYWTEEDDRSGTTSSRWTKGVTPSRTTTSRRAKGNDRTKTTSRPWTGDARTGTASWNWTDRAGPTTSSAPDVHSTPVVTVRSNSLSAAGAISSMLVFVTMYMRLSWM
uniref:Peptidase_M13 domain-containing protein n=1 Tax=Steinernema glaseri TaxID=37863 RepID=A0A1I8ABW9_9BILA